MNRINKYFHVWLTVGITLLLILLFVLASLLFQQTLYNILVEQALKDNKVIGQSVISLLEKNHDENEVLDTLISEVQQSCDILKLPNGGYICAADQKGTLVAFPMMKPSDKGKENIREASFTNNKNQKEDIKKFLYDSVFAGLYEYKDINYSDIIVKLKHKSGLNILVHQDNNAIMKKSNAESFKLLIFGIVASLCTGAILFVFIDRQTRSYQKTIEKQNYEIKKSSIEIKASHDSIIDSINYAQRIQQAILPLKEELDNLLGEYFIFFKPKDIVSGDFYYLQENQGKIILASVDCTGHGVPGAFMSMIANDMLNEIILNRNILESDMILNELHKSIRKVLRQEENMIRDGMDISLIVIDKSKGYFEFSGAKNSLVYIQNNQLYEIKGNRLPIGGEQRENERIFDKHTIKLGLPVAVNGSQEGSQPFSESADQTMVYIFSDGYQDQFGGPDSKKFMSKQLKEVFSEIHLLPTNEQKSIIDERLRLWMKSGKQIDDILMIGLRL